MLAFSLLGGLDYQGGNFIITFSGAASEPQCQNVTILRDNETEPDEMFTLNLVESSIPEARVQLGSVNQTIITITGKGLSLWLRKV